MSPSPSVASERPSSGIDGIELARRLLVTVAVLAVVGTLLALVLVQRVGTTYRDGLEITADAASVASSSVEEASAVIDDVAALGGSIAVTLDQTEIVLRSSADALDGIGTAMGENIADGVEGTAEIANGLAGFIEAIERFIPGNSDSLAESLRKLSDGLEPTPDQLRTLADDLATTADQLRATAVSLQPVRYSLDVLIQSVEDSQSTLDEAQRLAGEVHTRTEAALDRSSRDLLLARILVIVMGLGVAAACIAAARALPSIAAAARRSNSAEPGD